ncbi:hypothetical protein IQ25_03906 [Novosphingobium taihuense]|nr:hypothetical protein IQ25_03906 [Novosphingobium taihuense]
MPTAMCYEFTIKRAAAVVSWFSHGFRTGQHCPSGFNYFRPPLRDRTRRRQHLRMGEKALVIPWVGQDKAVVDMRNCSTCQIEPVGLNNPDLCGYISDVVALHSGRALHLCHTPAFPTVRQQKICPDEDAIMLEGRFENRTAKAVVEQLACGCNCSRQVGLGFNHHAVGIKSAGCFTNLMPCREPRLRTGIQFSKVRPVNGKPELSRALFEGGDARL